MGIQPRRKTTQRADATEALSRFEQHQGQAQRRLCHREALGEPTLHPHDVRIERNILQVRPRPQQQCGKRCQRRNTRAHDEFRPVGGDRIGQRADCRRCGARHGDRGVEGERLPANQCAGCTERRRDFQRRVGKGTFGLHGSRLIQPRRLYVHMCQLQPRRIGGQVENTGMQRNIDEPRERRPDIHDTGADAQSLYRRQRRARNEWLQRCQIRRLPTHRA